MYKLTVVAGPSRGTSFAIQDGETTIGRQTGNTIVLSSSKVSKRHCTLIVSGTSVTLRDDGSSNGTFINGILAKSKPLRAGDKISVGEFVLELTRPVRRVSSPVPSLGGLAQDLIPSGAPAPGSGIPGGLPGTSSAGAVRSDQPPKDIKGKLLWYFENQLMPIFYNMNSKTEWRVLCVGFVGAFVLGNLLISVYPLLEANRSSIVKESARRARFMARQIAEVNAPYLAARAEAKTDVGMIENAEGVRLAALTDLDNRILAPGIKMNQYLPPGPEALLAVRARDQFRAGKETGFALEADPTTVVAIEPVKVLNPAVGRNVVVAMAIVSIDTSIATLEAGEMGVVYSETLILTGILAGFIFLVLYRLTLKPLEALNDDMDKALKGELGQVSHNYKFEELNPLWEIINSAIQRAQKGGSAEAGLGSGAGDSSQASDAFANPLRALGSLVKFGMVLFNSEKKIIYLNSVFEDLSGIRADSAIGADMSTAARDQALVAFTQDMLERAPSGGEGVIEDFDFSGIPHKVYAGAFGGMGEAAKCYFMAFIRTEA